LRRTPDFLLTVVVERLIAVDGNQSKNCAGTPKKKKFPASGSIPHTLEVERRLRRRQGGERSEFGKTDIMGKKYVEAVTSGA